MPYSFAELVTMARGRQEFEWDLSNSIMAQVVNSAGAVCDNAVMIGGGKPKARQQVDFTKLNPYRD